MQLLVTFSILMIVVVGLQQAATEECKIKQKLDHFTPGSSTWNMTYYTNTDHFRNGGPIIINISPGPDFSIRNNLLEDIGKDIGAYLVAVGARYSAVNIPTPDLSVESLKYLTTDQILADYAHLVEYLRSHIPGLKQSNVFLFGAGIFGAYASWFRITYPELSSGIITVDAPNVAKLSVSDYYDNVADNFRNFGSDKCVRQIQDGFEQFRYIFKHYGQMQPSFDFCNNLNATNSQNLFMDNLMQALGYFVTFATPHEIRTKCAQVLEPATDPAAELFNLMIQASWQDKDYVCNNANYQHYLENLRDTSAVSQTATMLGYRQLQYQRCTEHGWKKTTTVKPPFMENVPVSSFIDLCEAIFGEKFNQQHLESNIHKFNLKFGGLTPNIHNALFVSCAYNPLRSISILTNLNQSAFAALVNDGPSFSVFDSIRSNDSEEMHQIKQQIKSLIKTWNN